MTYLLFLPLIIALSLYLVPAIVLSQPSFKTAKDFFVGSSQTSPIIFQNSSIAYQLQMATFGAFFLWGVTEDYRPALVNSVCFLVGLLLIYRLRHPLIRFLNDALRGDSSITVHEFLARKYGDARLVRLVSSLLTVVALIGIAIGEIFGVATVIRPLMPQDVQALYIFVFGMLLLMFVYTVSAGNSGVMRSDQAQLGTAYFGLFVAALMMLAGLYASGKPLSPQVVLCTLVFGGSALMMLIYRRFRFLDTSLLQANSKSNGNMAEHPASVRAFNHFERFLNVSCVVLAVALMAFAVLAFRQVPLASLSAAFSGAVLRPTTFPTIAIVALILLPIFYQFVDITNWQRIAAFEKTNAELSDRERKFRRSFLIYAIESPIVWILMCMFGTLCAAALLIPANAKDMSAVTSAVNDGTVYGAILLMAFLIAVFSIALSTMSAVFSATLCAIRYDILPSFHPTQSAGRVSAVQEAHVARRAIAYGVLAYLLIAAGLYGVDAAKISFGSSQYLSLLFSFYCAQLSFVPLILGPILLHPKRNVSSGWALFVLLAGTTAGILPVGWSLYTGSEIWFWSGIPLCLTVGVLLYLLGLLICRENKVV